MPLKHVTTATAFCCLVLFGACDERLAEPPNGDTNIAQGGFADVVLAVGEQGDAMVRSCTDSIPACTEGMVLNAGCSDVPVLGEPDSQTFSLGPGGRLDVGFLCTSILETGLTEGSCTPDLKIWATVPEGASAIVQASFDGSLFLDLDLLRETNQGMELERIQSAAARFIRIVYDGDSGPAITIDAVEALPRTEDSMPGGAGSNTPCSVNPPY